MMLNSTKPILKKKSHIGWANNTNLIILAFSTVFYARIICTLTPLPSILNHAHLAIVPLVFLIAVITTPTKDRQQIKLILFLLSGLFIFLIAILTSAFWNQAGLINAIASFIMLGEPVLLVATMACIPMTVHSFKKLKQWLMYSMAINFFLAAIQKPLINSGRLYAGGFNGTDGCGGVFFVSGAGNYVSASVSVAFALYFFFNEKIFPLWVRILVFLAAFWHVLFSDSKQLVLAYALAWLILVLINTKDIKKSLKLLIGIIVISLIFFWCVQNIEAFAAFKSWARPELYGKDGDAWYAKFYSINVILSEFQSPLNWLFGLGPGHTVSRLGAWFLQDYASILAPLGATTKYIGVDAREFVGSFWLTLGSSLFSPIFGWAGIWGDLGLVGLSVYFYLGYLVWQNFALDDSLKVTLLSIFVMGFIFTQMEEPGYMLSIAMILGLAWQERRIKRLERERAFFSGETSSLENEGLNYHSYLFYRK